MITVINGKVNDDDKLRVCKQKKQEKKKQHGKRTIE